MQLATKIGLTFKDALSLITLDHARGGWQKLGSGRRQDRLRSAWLGGSNTAPQLPEQTLKIIANTGDQDTSRPEQDVIEGELVEL